MTADTTTTAPTVAKPFTASKTQIAEWKKEHAFIYHITIKDKACYLKKPDRIILGAMELAETTFHKSELILNQCWLDGDEEIKHVDDYFVGVASKLGLVIDYEVAEIKKL